MIEPTDILVSNLKDALNQLQRYMVFGLGASLFLLVLAGNEPSHISGGSSDIKLPGEFLPVPVSLPVAVSVVVAAYWVAGLLATIVVSRANRIVEALRDSPELLEAVLTYPSIPTTKVHAPRIGLALLPVLFIGGAAFISGQSVDSSVKVFALIMLLLPNLVLTVQLRAAIGGQRPDRHGD